MAFRPFVIDPISNVFSDLIKALRAGLTEASLDSRHPEWVEQPTQRRQR